MEEAFFKYNEMTIEEARGKLVGMFNMAVQHDEMTTDNIAQFARAVSIAHICMKGIETCKERGLGKWIEDYNNTYHRCRMKCSICGKFSGIGGIKSNQMKPFCPNCGAKMAVTEEDED